MLRRCPLCPSEEAFNSSDNSVKKIHSDTLSALLYIAHVLPLASSDYDILITILYGGFKIGYDMNFHQQFQLLNGWNDDIVRPARDAVFEYYKVRTLHYYLCTSSLTLKPDSWTLFIVSAMRSPWTLNCICV